MEIVTITRQTPFEELPQFLTPEELRRYLGLGRSTIYQLIESGEVPCRKFGRRIFIPKDALV